MARVTVHLGTRERLEARISKATPLGALPTEALVCLGATCISGPAPAMRALADALVAAAPLAEAPALPDASDAYPPACNEREQAERAPDRCPLDSAAARPAPAPGRRSP